MKPNADGLPVAPAEALEDSNPSETPAGRVVSEQPLTRANGEVAQPEQDGNTGSAAAASGAQDSNVVRAASMRGAQGANADNAAAAQGDCATAGNVPKRKVVEDQEIMAKPVTSEDFESADEAIGHMRSVIDNRVMAMTMLLMLLLAIIGLKNIVMFIAFLFVGYLAIERFVSVRRCIIIGGAAWLFVMLIGAIVTGNAPAPVFFSAEFVFMFSGFLLALAVCAAFFAGRYMYYYGYGRGEAEADRAIAAHVQDRLIDRPDEWGQIDGDFLEVESALNRVRDRERATAQALRDESSRKDDLVTYLAHDLKTPLASVVGYLSLLEEAPDLPVEQRARFTGIALAKAHRLDELIEEFFDITRFDFHDIVLTRGYIDLSLMLAQVADEFYPTLSEQHKDVSIDINESITVLVDGDKMARVFNNVMKNAIAYSYEGTTIAISAARVGQEVIIKFANQGDPIPAAKLKVIFEKFYRLDAARATNRGGAGLGLAIAKEIVTAHGGTISCTSTAEKTEFTIALPLEDTTSEETA